MAPIYQPEELIVLRDSPLCLKPPGLPPAEEWMGSSQEALRTQNKTVGDRAKENDHSLTGQNTKRPGLDRGSARSTPNPEDIILGPPKTNFASSTSMRNSRPGEMDKSFRDQEPRDRGVDRFNLRAKAGEAESNAGDRFARDGRGSAFRRRGEGDQDGEGWSTVKPRKSFGAEGAERFHGRMGAGGGDRFGGRDDRRTRDREDENGGAGERRLRTFNGGLREKDEDESESARRNGPPRGKSDSWFKEGSGEAAPSQREKIDRAKSWRDRDPDDRPAERRLDRNNDRNADRRWDRDRDQRQEKEPEWFDEPIEDKSKAHTADDLKKFMEDMKKSRGGPSKADSMLSGAADILKPEPADTQPKLATAPAAQSGPDRFFTNFGSAGLDLGTPQSEIKPVSSSKPSRFTSFFASQEEHRGKTEPPTPVVVEHQQPQPPPPPPPAAAQPYSNIGGGGGLGALFQAAASEGKQGDKSAEKLAFANLLQKLQNQSLTQNYKATAASSSQPAGPFADLVHALDNRQQQNFVKPPEPFAQYGGPDRRDEGRMARPEDPRLRQDMPRPLQDDPRFRQDEPRMRAPTHQLHDIISPRPLPLPAHPPPVSSPEHAIQELLAHRQHAQSQGSGRMEQHTPLANDNSVLLMKLMQRAREVPETLRPEQIIAGNARVRAEPPRHEQILRQPQPMKQVSVPNIPDREPDYQRERSASQRQMRGQGLPSFLEEQFHAPPEHDNRPQPTQILQRPPPPGLDHHMPPFPMGAGGQMPPQQRGPMIPPPPGLLNNPRGLAMSGMMPPPPNFPHPHFPPPDSMMGPPRGMPPPPGFPGNFNGPPPPGFVPPGMGNFPGPEGMPFGNQFDARVMPPPGANGAFRRP